jgi:predicted phosphoribosyltransferase
MEGAKENKIIELRHLHNRSYVFKDRAAAGKVLAEMLEKYRGSDALVLAVPAGGVAVASVIAKELNLPLDVAVVSKITLSWNSEVGYGGVAFDGTMRLNEELLCRMRLSEQEIREGTKRTEQKVARRVKKLRGDRPMPDFRHPLILVDDGLASGFTLVVAIEALRKSGARKIILAVPTAHEESLQRVLDKVEAIYCPNIRGGSSFAVAEAYEDWYDLDEEEVVRILSEFHPARGSA